MSTKSLPGKVFPRLPRLLINEVSNSGHRSFSLNERYRGDINLHDEIGAIFRGLDW